MTSTAPLAAALAAIRKNQNTMYAERHRRPDDFSIAREARLAALRNFASAMAGDMSAEEFEEISAQALSSSRAVYATTYGATLTDLVGIGR